MAEGVLEKFYDLVGNKNYFTTFVADRYADKRVNNWPLMEYPHKAVGISIFYLLAIYVFLPRYMKNRKPYELKLFIQCYNIFQVIACSLLIYRTLTSGWTTTYTLGCQPIVFSEDPLAIQMAGCFWWAMVLKFIEFIETIIFALRKKSNQISGLHIYHHLSSLFIAWMTCKYAANGMPSFGILVNCGVHVLMYSYYFLTSLGPEMQKKLTFVKSKLTIIQMAQLIILFLHTLQALSPNCDVTIYVPGFYIPVLVVNMILFLKFYRKTYLNKKDQ